MKSKATSSCGCGGGGKSVVVIEAVKKRKRQPPQSVPTVKKTQLQVETEQRKKNRQRATKMAQTAKRQLLQKYPPQENVLNVPKHKGIFFPPKQDTERLIHRQKVNEQVGKVMSDIRKKNKEATTKWTKSPSGTWTKNKKKK